MRTIRFGNDHDARRVPIQAVDNPWTLLPANPAKARAVEQHGVNQRSMAVPTRRMHDQPRRLVDDKEVFILVENI